MTTFLGTGDHADPDAVLLGVPYDATATFRRGCALAPDAIRWASQSIEAYSPILRRDLEDKRLTDRGDLDVGRADPPVMVEAVRAGVAALPERTLPVLLGGEHTMTIGAIQALRERHPDLALLQLDAHTDLRDEYDGRRLSHATVMRRITDVIMPDHVVALGLRAGTREEFALADRYRAWAPRLTVMPDVWAWLQNRPVYVTIDIDVIDPSDAPGTGNPEPEGIAAGDLLRFVRSFGDLQVVGADLVEVSPPYDPSGRTAVLAATVIREILLSVRSK